jgi:protein ImuB
MEGQMDVQEIFAILHKWGIHTLGQLAALDKEQLGARLGPEAIRMWERANGRSSRLLKLIRPPESFEESFEFEREIETAEPLLFMLRRFLEQLAVRLAAIYLVAKELTLRITFANSRQVRHGTDSSDWRNEPAVAGKQSYERVFKIPQPTNEVDLLFRMLRRIWRIFDLSIRSLPSRSAQSRSNLPGNNSDYLKRHCATRINFQKHSHV